jgi:hypothetical protein
MTFIHTPATNPTQHDVHGQDDTPTTIDYHQLDLSRDGGMDKQEIYRSQSPNKMKFI